MITAQDNARSTAAFLKGLADEASRHPALRHPWLCQVRDHGLDRAAARDLAWHLHGHVAWAPRFLRAGCDAVDRPEHARALESVWAAHRGQVHLDECQRLRRLGIDPTDLSGVPRVQLLEQFGRAVGLDGAALLAPPAATVRWRSRLMSFLRRATPAAVVGALGPGTESIAEDLYAPILSGLRRVDGLAQRDRVFFELPGMADGARIRGLLAAAADLASTSAGRRDLHRGMRTALDLQCEFWDAVYLRTVRGPQVVSA